MAETYLNNLKGRKKSGHKPIERPVKKKYKAKEGHFDPGAVKDNWLFDPKSEK